MNKAALFLWAVVLIILGTGFYGFYVVAAGSFVLLLPQLIFYKRIQRYEWRKQDEKYLDWLFHYGQDKNFFEKKRQEYIDRWPDSKPPRTWLQRKEAEREYMRKMDKWYWFIYIFKSY